MKKIIQKEVFVGYSVMKRSSIVICSIVRDCNKSLIRNIPRIEKLRSSFMFSQVVIFENDSKDGTKDTIKEWSEKSVDVIINSTNINDQTIPKKTDGKINKYFSYFRISKMASYRNEYMRKIRELEYNFDFVLIIDLDIASFNIDGIAHSFGLYNQWDAVTSFGYSYSPFLKKRYHDSFALVEYGDNLIQQSEKSILNNQSKWAFLKPGMPIIPVYSAFGGLAIYKFEAIKNKKYEVIKNYNTKVEVKCEHFSLCDQMHHDNYSRIFINPNMSLLYQGLSFSLVRKYIINRLNLIKHLNYFRVS